MVATPQPPQGAPPGAPAGGIPAAPPLVPAKKKGLSTGAKIALVLCACAVFLIIVLGVIFFVGAIGAPTKVANNYVKALNSGDLSTAWNYISSSTQKVNTRSGFDSKMRKLKNDISKWNTSNFKVQTGGRTTIVMDLTHANGTKVTWDMYLVKENGEWKIARVIPRT